MFPRHPAFVSGLILLAMLVIGAVMVVVLIPVLIIGAIGSALLAAKRAFNRARKPNGPLDGRRNVRVIVPDGTAEVIGTGDSARPS